MDYFTSDLHLGHRKIIEYCNRPFATVAEMDKTILDNINDVVMPDDRLFIVGDFALYNVQDYRSRINCNAVKILDGNHDPLNRTEWGIMYNMLEFKTYIHALKRYQGIVLCHFPIDSWHWMGKGYWQLFGHVHANKLGDIDKLNLNVGVDYHNYRPLSINQVAEFMAKKTWKPPTKKEHVSDVVE